MRYEAAVELARRVMERTDIDSTRFVGERRENPLLTDHDEPVYDLYYQPSSARLSEAMGEIAASDSIDVEITPAPADAATSHRLQLYWCDPVDDVFSYTGQIVADQHRDRTIEGTIRTDRDGATVTLNTAENGHLYRVVLSAESTGNVCDGTESVEMSHVLFVDGEERESHAEELFVDDSPEEVARGWVPADEGLDHVLFEHEASAASA